MNFSTCIHTLRTRASILNLSTGVFIYVGRSKSDEGNIAVLCFYADLVRMDLVAWPLST